MRIRTKLLLGALALLGGIAYRSGRQSIEASLGRLFELQAFRAVELVDREVGARQRTGPAWASLDVLQDGPEAFQLALVDFQMPEMTAGTSRRRSRRTRASRPFP
jgi:hypothetical protein